MTKNNDTDLSRIKARNRLMKQLHFHESQHFLFVFIFIFIGLFIWVKNTLCNPDRPQIHSNPPASVSHAAIRGMRSHAWQPMCVLYRLTYYKQIPIYRISANPKINVFERPLFSPSEIDSELIPQHRKSSIQSWNRKYLTTLHSAHDKYKNQRLPKPFSKCSNTKRALSKAWQVTYLLLR